MMGVECKGCAERREKIRAQIKAWAEWVMNHPTTGSPESPSSMKLPPTPQIHARPIKSKKELPS